MSIVIESKAFAKALKDFLHRSEDVSLSKVSKLDHIIFENSKNQFGDFEKGVELSVKAIKNNQNIYFGVVGGNSCYLLAASEEEAIVKVECW